MNGTRSRGRVCLEWLRVWALEEDVCRDAIQNLVSRISDLLFVSGVCKNTDNVCAQSGTALFVSSMHVLCLTGERGISESWELVDEIGWQLEA